MALIKSEDFENGTSGAAITAANSNAVTFFGNAGTFQTGAVEGSLCGQFAGVATAATIGIPHADTVGVAWVSLYFRFDTIPAANTYFAQWASSGGSKIGDIRINPAGTLTARDNITASVTSTSAVTAGVWNRLAWRVTRNTQMEMKLYLGANLHGSTPDWQGTGPSTQDFIPGNFTTGLTAAATATVKIDRIRIDNAAEPESMIPAGVPLDAPTITATTTNPSTIGGTDGTVRVNMPVPVGGAATYEVRRLNAAAVVQETVQRTFAQFPHTFTGRPAETGSVDVQAKP